MSVFDTMNKWWDTDDDGTVLDTFTGGMLKNTPIVGEFLGGPGDDIGDYFADYLGTRDRPDAKTSDEDYMPGKFERLPDGGYGQRGGWGTDKNKAMHEAMPGPGASTGKSIGTGVGAAVGLIGGPIGALLGAEVGAGIGQSIGHGVDVASDAVDELGIDSIMTAFGHFID